MWSDVVFILGSYIFGSIPHLRFLAKLRHVELEGDYHQSLWNRAGRIIGVIGVLGEFVKGALPVLAGKGLGLGLTTIVIGGLTAVCGQMWPVFSRFDGEKGNSVALGMAVALVPRPALVALVPVIVALIIRTVSRLTSKSGLPADRALVGGSYSCSLPLGMAICFLILPLASWYFDEPPEIIWCGVLLFILIMVRRLTSGLIKDLKSGNEIRGVLMRRVLYDRATTGWRQ